MRTDAERRLARQLQPTCNGVLTMSLPFFTSANPRAAHDGDGNNQWKQAAVALIALTVISAIAAGGGALSHFMGPPRAFILIVTAVAIWSIAGWFVGGWRAAT